jgi:hypothetical protein
MDDHTAAITIRRLDEGADAEAITRLGQLDSGVTLTHPVLGAEVEGRLLAAVSLADGTSAADPFSRTAELRALLEMRAAQARHRRPRGKRIRRPARARAALAGSVPGAGGRLLTLGRP